MSFTFGQSSGNSSTPNKPLVGTAGSSTGAAPSLFSTANTSSTPSNGLFGSAGTAPTSLSGTFGGGTLNIAAASKPSNIFGSNPSAAPAASSALGAGFRFGEPAGDASKPSLFSTTAGGNAASGTTSTPVPTLGFGTTLGLPPAATPAANKTSLFPSTTPAGAPPGNSLFHGRSAPGVGGQSGASLFGQQNTQAGSTAQTGSLLFGAMKPAAASTPSATTPNLSGGAASAPKPAAVTTPSSGLFSPGISGASNDANKPAITSTPASSGLFGAGLQAPSSATQSTDTASKSGLFGGFGSTTPFSGPAKPLFSLGTAPSAQSTAQPAPSSAPSFSLAGDKSAGAASTTPASNLFSAVAGSNVAAPASSSSLFSLGKPAGATSAAGASSSTTSGANIPTASTSSPLPAISSATGSSQFPSLATSAAPGTATTSTSTPSLFSKPATSGPQQPASATISQPAPSLGATVGVTSSDAVKTVLGSSTAGLTPSAQSRLKNKSMDEIITRWASDLAKHQKEFAQQAETVAKWDRALVENSDKVRQLYSKTFQAERDAAEVERQLTMMEENQQELDSYLDRYEKEIENLMKMRQLNTKSDPYRGPDQERERTYKLAEKLQDRLNELNKDLTEMIEEINNTSQTLSKTGKPDDPLTKVVRVLNGQLAQLQLIDSGASQLREKISAAQKESQHVSGNGWNGLGTDASEDFYRSYLGGRAERYGGVL